MWLLPCVPIVFEELQPCFFPAELVDLQGAGGRNLAIELSVSFFFIFATFLLFFKECGLLARLSRRAVLLTPRNYFWALLLIPGICFG